MAGQNILVVDDSVAVQELCRMALENNGYKVTVASNGAAALTHPQVGGADLVILDTALRDIDGYETARAFRVDPELHDKPVLLLVPEDNISDRESQNLLGASAYLAKPFEPAQLVNKVQILLEERETLQKGREYLRDAAEKLMKSLAESTLQEAVAQKTQIIIERALQLVITQVDQRARKEVDAKVTQLTAEKEQELVKMTVHEVARSMVEKLAEKKVTEAMESILRDETDRSVRRAADAILPDLTRDRARETIDQMLPKEVQRRVQQEAASLVPDASEKVVSIIESAANKLVPRIAREIVGEVLERVLTEAMDQQLPRHVQQLVGQELEAQIRLKLQPLVREASHDIEKKARRATNLTAALALVTFFIMALLLADRFFPGGLTSRLLPPHPAATAPAPPPETATPPANPLQNFLRGIGGQPGQ